MSSAKYLQKRVGYLGAVQSFRPDTEVLMLATNLLKKVKLLSTSKGSANAENGLGHKFNFREYHVPTYHNATTYNYFFTGSFGSLGSSPTIDAFTSNNSKEDYCDIIQTGAGLPGDLKAGMAQDKRTADG